MSTDNTELIRAAKYEALEEAMKAVEELEKTEKGRRLEGLKNARNAIEKVAENYWGKVQIDRFNAMHNAYHNGGSSRGAAFVSADMKPDKE